MNVYQKCFQFFQSNVSIKIWYNFQHCQNQSRSCTLRKVNFIYSLILQLPWCMSFSCRRDPWECWALQIIWEDTAVQCRELLPSEILISWQSPDLDGKRKISTLISTPIIVWPDRKWNKIFNRDTDWKMLFKSNLLWYLLMALTIMSRSLVRLGDQ